VKLTRWFYLNIVLHLAALWPAVRLLVGFLRLRGGADLPESSLFSLTANPVEKITLVTGTAALTLLLCTLAVSPLRKLTGWNSLIKLRRPLGLYAFFYACLHLLTYLLLDRGLDFSGIGGDILKRRFITAGFTAWLLMLPLTITSTTGWIRRLGRNWTRLHWLIYPAAIAAITHFLWKVKVINTRPATYAAILALLLLWRVATIAGARLKSNKNKPIPV
jgi:sulfoxide reductase heme-binding subunit YedZ